MLKQKRSGCKNSPMSKIEKAKDPMIWMRLGKRCDAARSTLSRADYVTFLRAQPEFVHEATGKPVKDITGMTGRIINISRMQVLWDNADKLPWAGWGTLRELSKLGDRKLRHLFAHGLINSGTARAQVDALRTAQYPERKAVAPRHPKKPPSDTGMKEDPSVP
jgi:hypothetical protein